MRFQCNTPLRFGQCQRKMEGQKLLCFAMGDSRSVCCLDTAICYYRISMKNLDKILLHITRTGVYLVPFIPLVISATLFFPFITGKGFAFRILIEVIFALWVLLALRDPAYRPRLTLPSIAVATFLIVIFLADVFGANPHKSLWSNYERMEGFVALIHLGAFFLVASSTLREEKWWRRLFHTSVAVSIIIAIYGIFQLAGVIVINQGGVRLDGTFGNAAYLAAYMLLHAFLTLFLIASHRSPSMFLKCYLTVALLLQFFTLYHTATRGAMVGLIAGLFLTALLIAIFERESKRLRKGISFPS